MIILDTNVISETIRGVPEPIVVEHLKRYPSGDLYTTAITAAEIRLGLALLTQGRKRSALRTRVDRVLVEDFEGRILPFDSVAAEMYAAIVTARRAMGKPISVSDAQIAAIAYSHSAVLITRDTRDFEHCGLHLINPWTGG